MGTLEPHCGNSHWELALGTCYGTGSGSSAMESWDPCYGYLAMETHYGNPTMESALGSLLWIPTMGTRHHTLTAFALRKRGCQTVYEKVDNRLSGNCLPMLCRPHANHLSSNPAVSWQLLVNREETCIFSGSCEILRLA